ncbi:hypothetical protein NUW58_g5027 [Xylaria curta]|uniref:Uncharacterized protein n=1 Tax=Xylaria curta TaxID=42375 RepID=A0ACC1P3L8_9PEZI|nr:hypothetical protein NUW58_g5027 [Xylaria curta]
MPEDASMAPSGLSIPTNPIPPSQRSSPNGTNLPISDPKIPGQDEHNTIEDIKDQSLSNIIMLIHQAEDRCIERNNAESSRANDKKGLVLEKHTELIFGYYRLCLAASHPRAPAKLKNCSKSLPLRMWEYGMKSFLDSQPQHLPQSKKKTDNYISFSSCLAWILFNKVPDHADKFAEILARLALHKGTTTKNDKEKEVWLSISHQWFSHISHNTPTAGYLYHFLGMSTLRPLERLYNLVKSSCVPDISALPKKSFTMFLVPPNPDVNSGSPGLTSADFPTLDREFVDFGPLDFSFDDLDSVDFSCPGFDFSDFASLDFPSLNFASLDSPSLDFASLDFASLDSHPLDYRHLNPYHLDPVHANDVNPILSNSDFLDLDPVHPNDVNSTLSDPAPVNTDAVDSNSSDFMFLFTGSHNWIRSGDISVTTPVIRTFIEAHSILHSHHSNNFSAAANSFYNLLEDYIKGEELEQQAYQIAIINCCALLEYGGGEHLALDGTPAKTEPRTITLDFVNTSHTIFFEQPRNANVLPYVHVVLVFMLFIVRSSGHTRLLIEESFPWTQISVLLNLLLGQAITPPECLNCQKEDESNNCPPPGAHQSPLPEDISLRGLRFVDAYLAEWSGLTRIYQEKHGEKLVKTRRQRIIRLASRIARAGCPLVYDGESKQYRVKVPNTVPLNAAVGEVG